MIALTNLVYSYPAVSIALPGHHEFSPGELVHLVGRNGCGKSTILKIMAGLLDDYAGELSRPARWAVRYVPTNITAALFLPWYSMRKNVELLVGEDRARDSFQTLGTMFFHGRLARLLQQPAYSPSAGECSAIAIACALASSPNAILLDETLLHIHCDLAARVAAALESYVRNGGLLLVAGHHALPFTMQVRVLQMGSTDDDES